MSLRFYILISAVLLLEGGTVLAQSFWEPLIRREKLAGPLPYERIECFSSRGFGATNEDRGNYLGRDANNWNILCDIEGPGVLAEFGWTRRNPGDQLRFRIFADDTTVWDVNVRADSLCGRMSPFLPPIADSSSGWYWNYAPVPFNDHLRITYIGNTMAYHGCAQLYNDSVQFESFRVPVPLGYFLKRDTMESVWSQPQRPALWNRPADIIVADSTLQSFRSAELLTLDGSGVVRRLWVVPQDTTRSYLDRTVLRVFVDHNPEPSVAAQFGMLFGCSWGVTPYASAITGRSGDTLYFQAPMAFSTDFRVEIENNVATPATNRIRIGAEIVEMAPADVPSYRLGARVTSSLPTRRYDGFRAAEFSGRGNFLGLYVELENTSGSVLEGDEALTVDGHVVRNGLGTTEYFNGSYNWLAPNGQPALSRHFAHGVVTVTNNDYAAYRYHQSDAVPFNESLTLDFEVGGWGHLTGNYRALALAYLEPQRFTVRDQDSSHTSVGGEVLYIYGRGLANGRVLNRILWNDIELERTGGQYVVSDSALNVRVRAPFVASGIAPLIAEFSDGATVIDPEWEHRAAPTLDFRVTRDEIDGFAFAGDTIAIELRGYPPGEGARVIFEDALLPWVGAAPLATGNGVITGRVTMPAHPADMPEARAKLTAEAVSVEGYPDAVSDLELVAVRLQRFEIERLFVTESLGGTAVEMCACDFQNPDSLDPWGRMLVRRFVADTLGERVSFRFDVRQSGNYRLNYFFGKSFNSGYCFTMIDGAEDLDSARMQDIRLFDGRWDRSDTLRGLWRYLEADTHIVTFMAVPVISTEDTVEMVLDQLLLESEFHQIIPYDAGERTETVTTAELLPPFPNPFNPTTRLRFTLNTTAHVKLEVFNVLGQLVSTVADERLDAGLHERFFACPECASGLYLARLTLPNDMMTRKLLLLK